MPGGCERQVHVELADMSSLCSVRAFASHFSARRCGLHVLINNAGVLAGERDLSADGHEPTFATNLFGMFLLTDELLPQLLSGAPSRLISVSSGGMYTASDLESESGDGSGPAAYRCSKRAQVVLTELWAERLRGTGIVVHAIHPGWADTPGVAHWLPTFHRLTGPLLRSPSEGADTIAWLASAPEPARSSGPSWHDRRARPTRGVPWTHESESGRQELWEACMRAGGANRPSSGETLARRQP